MVRKSFSSLCYCVIFQTIQGPQKVKVGSDKVVTAKNIIIATGSVPFVPKGIEVDGVYPLLLILFMVSPFLLMGPVFFFWMVDIVCLFYKFYKLLFC